jgi:hypothetical protein
MSAQDSYSQRLFSKISILRSGTRTNEMIRKALITIFCGAYPLWFMWPVLVQNRIATIGWKPTDVSASIQFAQIYSSQATPWSRNLFTNFPFGESAWRWQEFTQLMPRSFLWLGSHFFSPIATTNLLIYLGWAGTGLATYVLAKRIGLKPIFAMSAVLIIEALPWLRLRAINHPGYMHMWPLVLMLIAVMDSQSTGFLKNAKRISLAFALCALFDPYFAWFAVLILAIGMLTTPSTLDRRVGLKLKTTGMLIIGSIVLLQVLVRTLDVVLNSGNDFGNSRKVGNTDLGFLSYFSGQLTDWFRTGPSHLLFPQPGRYDVDFAVEHPAYGGFICAIGLGFLLLGIWNRNKSHERVLSVVVIVAILMTLKPILNLGPFAFPNITYFLRYAMIGVRHPGRFGLIAQIVLPMIALIEWQNFINKRKVKGLRKKLWSSLGLGLLVFAIIDLNPWAGREIFQPQEDFSSLNAAIKKEAKPSLLVLPLDGLSRPIQNYVNVPIANSLFGSKEEQEIAEAASRGPLALSSLLSERKITHVLLPDRYSTNATWNSHSRLYDLPSELFALQASAFLPGVYTGESIKFDLYKVLRNSLPSCKSCGIGPYSTELQFSGDLLPLEGDIRWSMGGDVQILLPTSLTKTFIYDLSIKIVTLSPNHEILVEHDGIKSVEKINGLSKTLFWRVSSEQVISISNISPCATPESLGNGIDPRKLCYGVTTTEVRPVQVPDPSNHELLEKK